MKNTLLSLLVAASAVSTASAQSTLNAANMNPVHGEVYYGHRCDTNVSKGASGAHITWNFTGVTEIGLDTLTYLACDSTAFCGSFPGSNFAAVNGGVYAYASVTTAGLSMKGIHGMGSDIVYDNAQDVVRYPLTYNTVFADTSSYSNSGIGYYHTQIDSYICDGYGTLKLPASTDTNTLRVHAISYTIDSIDLGGFTNVSTSRSESYIWYKPGYHNALFSINYDTTGSVSGQPYVSDVAYYVKKASSGGATSVKEVGQQKLSLQAYPNPAANDVHIRFDIDNAAAATITINDLMGRVVATIDGASLVNGVNDVTYPVSEIPSGIYIVHLKSEAGSASQKLTITK